MQVAAALFGTVPDAVVLQRLSPAERDIHALLRLGLSTDEIARLRNRSPHTVANQVSAILRKTNSPSRRALPPPG